MADRIDIGVGPRLGFEPTDDSGFTFTPKEELTRKEYLSQYVDFSRQTLKPLTGLKEETGIGVDAPEVGQDIDVSLGDSGPETDLVDIYGTIFDNNLQEQVSKSQFGFEETGSSEHASYADYLKTTGNVDRVSDVSNFYAPLANDVLGNISKGKFKDVTFENFDISLDISGAGDRIEKEIKDQLTTKDLGKRGMAAAFSAMGPPIVGSVIGGVIGGTEQLDEFGDPSIRPSGAMGALYDISMARSYDIMNNIKAANNASQYSAVEFGGTGKAGDLGFSAKLGGGQKILRDVGSNAYFKTGGRSHAEAKNIEAFSKGYIVNTFTFDETGGTDFFGNEKNVKVEDAGGVFAGKSGYYTPEGRFYSTRFQTTSAAGPAAAVTTSAKQYGVPEEVMEKAIMDARKGVGTVKGNIDRYKADEKAKADKIEKDKRDKKAAEIARQVEEARKQKEERSRQFSADIYGDDSGGFAAFETSGSYDAGGYSTGDFTGSGGTGTGGGGFTEGGAFSGLAAGGTVGMAAGGAMAAGMGSGFVDRPPSQVPEGQTVADDVETQMPEGAFVINAAAVEFAGEEDIKKMLNDAQKEAVRRGITIDNSKNSAKLIDVAISRGEVTVAPYLAKIIGYDRLNKINNRGKPETKERLQEAAQGGMLGMAEGGVASPTRRPKREQLADIELRADLETFIQGDALARLGYKLYEQGHIRFNTAVDTEDYGVRTRFKGAYFPPGNVRTDKRGVIPIRDIDDMLTGRVMEEQGIAPSQLKSDAGRVVLAGNIFDAPKKKGSDTLYDASETTVDMITIAHEFRHAALDYLSKTYDLGLPTLKQEERIMDYADNQAIERAGKVNPKLKERYFSNPDYELMSERGKSAGDKAYLRKQYEQYTGLAEEILKAMNVPPQSPAIEKEGFLTRTYKSLVN